MAENNHKYYIVEKSVLPEVFEKVLEAKRLLATGEASSVSEAAKAADLSRSAFYKYKDSIFQFYEKRNDTVVTVSAVLGNETGVLSSLLSCLAENGCNILTINQNIPANGTAFVTVSFEVEKLENSIEMLIEKLENINGISQVSLVGR